MEISENILNNTPKKSGRSRKERSEEHLEK
jgi:hypothetical protein